MSKKDKNIEVTDAQSTEKGAEDKKGKTRILEEKFFGNKPPRFLKTRRRMRTVEHKTLLKSSELATKYSAWALNKSNTAQIRIAELERMVAEYELKEKKEREEKLKAKQTEQATVVITEEEPKDGGIVPPPETA